MKQYKLTDQEVRWVAVCLQKDLRHYTLNEIVTEYNTQHPPSLPFYIKKNSVFIKPILRFLMDEGKVRSEVLTFYEEAIPATKFYVLTSDGIEYLSRRR
jgi:hypothetical protein